MKTIPRYRPFWLTVYGDNVVCSKHRTQNGAEKAAARCEKIGGSPHRAWRVVEYESKRPA